MKPNDFLNALDTNQQIAERALCRARPSFCACAFGFECAAAQTYGAAAAAVLKALGERKRLLVNRP